MTNLKSETTTNQEQGKKIEADMTPGCMHFAMRKRRSGGGGVEQRRFLLSLDACLCVFEDNDTKRQARLWNQVSQRELEKLWNQLEKEKEKEREREENERAGELLESGGSKEKKKKKEWGASGIKWK